MKSLAQRRQQIGTVIGRAGRIQVHRTDDSATPYLVSIISNREYAPPEILTATLGCACGEGEVDGVTLTEAEFDLVSKLEAKL
jgi:hypothetical protein